MARTYVLQTDILINSINDGGLLNKAYKPSKIHQHILWYVPGSFII